MLVFGGEFRSSLKLGKKARAHLSGAQKELPVVIATNNKLGWKFFVGAERTSLLMQSG